MRELTLLETGYLCGLLLLSLVLPMMMSHRGPQNATTKRSATKTVWTGQLLDALAGGVVLMSGSFAPYAAGFAVVSCVVCALVLQRKLQNP